MLEGVSATTIGTVLQVGEITARPEWFWLALGTLLMGVGTLYFLVEAYGVEGPEAKQFCAITTLIPAIAFSMYLSMLLGYGVTDVMFAGEEHPIYWARYADWLFTTPLLLLDLALLVDADRGTILGLVGADAFMIGTGLIGALTTVYEFRFVWWAISTAAMLYILYVLFFGFTKKANRMPEEVGSTFRILRNLVLVLWSAYPVVWLFGTEGAGLIPLGVETLLFMILDVSAKVGFGIILLRSRAIFGETETRVVDSGQLTDRQEEGVVETAYGMGYFDYPRDATATEVAEHLDIDVSTFAEHLALAQRKLLTGILRT